jgi:HlyD family secretion protein
MPILLHIGAIENRPYEAALEYISPKGFEDRGAIKFEIRAAITLDENTMLRSGYSANANIVLQKKEQALAVSEKNLIFENGRTYVDVETGDQEFERREITTGLSDGIHIEVVSGINEGDRIKAL